MDARLATYDSTYDIRLACRQIKECARLVRLYDSFIKDHRSKRHTKIGKQAATTPEIIAVIEIRTGVRPSNINRMNYSTTVNPDHSISVVERKQGATPLTATANELNNYFMRNFGVSSPSYIAEPSQYSNESPYIPGTQKTPQYVQEVVKQEDSKLLNTLAKITAVVTMLGGITAALTNLGHGVGGLRKMFGTKNEAAKEVANVASGAARKLSEKASRLRDLIKKHKNK